MKKFYFVDKDYQNESLNNMAKRITEYNAAEIINKYDFNFTNLPPNNSEWHEIGKIFMKPDLPFIVTDLYIVNDIFNYNVFFEKNTSSRIVIPENLYGTFDCLVSLAAGDMIKNNPLDIGLVGENHYIIDISPTALHKIIGLNLYKETRDQFINLDIFNENAIDKFLNSCKGTRGFFDISNCFMYIVNSLIYDVKLRLKMQNILIDRLANDKIEWYVNINSADGIFYPCVKASDIVNKKLDTRFEVFPWITM
jgi:hypothetical protein